MTLLYSNTLTSFQIKSQTQWTSFSTSQFIKFMMRGKNHSNIKFIHVYISLVASNKKKRGEGGEYMMQSVTQVNYGKSYM